MAVINTNISALVANNAVKQNDRAMSSAIEKLATGSRISSARDDAAGLSISARMATQISGLEMAARNVNDAISLVQTADGASKKITNMLGRMRELAVQASSDTYTATDRASLDLEYQALLLEIDRVAETTQWNGNKILGGDTTDIVLNYFAIIGYAGQNGNALNYDPYLTLSNDSRSVSIQDGAKADQSLSLSFKSWRTKAAVDGSMTAADGTNKSGVDDLEPERQLVRFDDVTVLANDDGDVHSVSLTIAGLTVTVSAPANHIVGVHGSRMANLFSELSPLNSSKTVEEQNWPSGNPEYVNGERRRIVTYSGALSGFVTGQVMPGTSGQGNSLWLYSVGTSANKNSGSDPDAAVIVEGGHNPGSNPYDTETIFNEHYLDTRSYDGTTKGNQSAYGTGLLYFGGNRFAETPEEPTALNLTTQANASQVVLELSAVLDGASAERAKYGAYLNRLEHSADNLSNISMNTLASLSRVADTDYALETTKLARAQIISQASTAMLAQANQSKQTVLALLR
jgi:flagellin